MPAEGMENIRSHSPYVSDAVTTPLLLYFLLLSLLHVTMTRIVPAMSETDLHHVFTHRHIVTSFIFAFGGSSFEDFRVAIFKRSAQTSSHQ